MAFLEVWFAPKTIGFFHYVLSMAMPNMKLIGEFVTQLEMPQALWAFLYKMAARGHFVFPIDDKNHRVLVIWDLNGYGEYEFNRCICDKVMASTSIGVRRRRWRRRRRRRRRNQKYNIIEIFKFRGYNSIVIVINYTITKYNYNWPQPWRVANKLCHCHCHIRYFIIQCSFLSESWTNWMYNLELKIFEGFSQGKKCSTKMWV